MPTTHDHVLVLRAPTLTLNPAFDAAVIAVEEAADPENAAAEYGAEWRKSGAGLVWASVLDAAIDAGVVERAPEEPTGDAYYTATVDLSGGTGQDSAGLSIQHEEEGEQIVVDGRGIDAAAVLNAPATVAVQDVLRGWDPPFETGAVVAEMARECRRFGISEVHGDGFAKGFAAAEFLRHDIRYVDTPKTTSECYLLALAAVNSRRVKLLDHPKARRQWLGLQRKYVSGGRLKVDHPSRAHDDLADVTAKGIVVTLGLGEDIKPKRLVRFG